jgi:hypothetical protein
MRYVVGYVACCVLLVVAKVAMFTAIVVGVASCLGVV